MDEFKIGYGVGGDLSQISEIQPPHSPSEQSEVEDHHQSESEGYRRSDHQLLRDASEALTRHPWLDATEILINVRGGLVLLHGIVQDEEQRKFAQEAVERVPGVGAVLNRLIVHPSFFTQFRQARWRP